MEFDKISTGGLGINSIYAAEDIMIDSVLTTNIQMDLGIGANDVFSDVALEAVSDKLKKFKANITIYAKKLFNFLFGWLIEFFRGTTNVKKAMKQSYAKAVKYLKELNKLSSKLGNAKKDATIKVGAYGNKVAVGLTLIQTVKEFMRSMYDGLKDVESNASASGNKEAGKASKGVVAINYAKLEKVTNASANLVMTVDTLVTDTSKLRSELVASQYNVKTMLDKYIKSASGGSNGVLGWTKSIMSFGKDYDIGKAKTSLKSKLEALTKEVETIEMSPEKAYEELRLQLQMFIDISKANKWEMENATKVAEQLRKTLSKLNLDNQDNLNNDTQKKGIKAIIAVGNSLGSIQGLSGAVMKNMASHIDNMITNVAQLGSMLIRIGG